MLTIFLIALGVVLIGLTAWFWYDERYSSRPILRRWRRKARR